MNPLHRPTPEIAQRYFIDVVPHSRELGMRYVENDVGRMVFDLPYQPHLVGDPETGVIHGGAITTLIDGTCGAALISKLPELRRIATLDLRIDYLRPARAGQTVRCEATCYRLTRQIAFLRATAHDGDPADPIATAASTFVVFKDNSASQTGLEALS